MRWHSKPARAPFSFCFRTLSTSPPEAGSYPHLHVLSVWRSRGYVNAAPGSAPLNEPQRHRGLRLVILGVLCGPSPVLSLRSSVSSVPLWLNLRPRLVSVAWMRVRKGSRKAGSRLRRVANLWVRPSRHWGRAGPSSVPGKPAGVTAPAYLIVASSGVQWTVFVCIGGRIRGRRADLGPSRKIRVADCRAGRRSASYPRSRRVQSS